MTEFGVDLFQGTAVTRIVSAEPCGTSQWDLLRLNNHVGLMITPWYSTGLDENSAVLNPDARAVMFAIKDAS